ncbi:MAG: Sec-independent protein translocase protein TatB [Pseudomonadota bacterium]
MFDIGWSELLLIAAVVIIVVGPKELPHLLRSMGQILNKVRSMSQEFRSHLDDAIKDTEIDKIRDDIQDVKSGKAFTEETGFDVFQDLMPEDTSSQNHHGTADAATEMTPTDINQNQLKQNKG